MQFGVNAMKTIDLSISVENESEAEALQSISELAMMGIESFYKSTGRAKPLAATKVLNILETLRDESEGFCNE